MTKAVATVQADKEASKSSAIHRPSEGSARLATVPPLARRGRKPLDDAGAARPDGPSASYIAIRDWKSVVE